jgi:hypothetical protein
LLYRISVRIAPRIAQEGLHLMKNLSAFALSALLLSTGVGYAQSTTPAPDAPMTMPMPPPPAATPKPAVVAVTHGGETYRISAGELAAIGVGAVVGVTLVHAVVGHCVMLVGAAVGGWVGDWWYNTPPHTMAAK